MKLKEQLRKPFDCIKPETLNELSEIAENFAIGFGKWLSDNNTNEGTIEQLLQIYEETL